jgi:hypothetical protein
MDPISSELVRTVVDDVELAFRAVYRHVEPLMMELTADESRRLAARLVMLFVRKLPYTPTSLDCAQATVDRLVERLTPGADGE